MPFQWRLFWKECVRVAVPEIIRAIVWIIVGSLGAYIAMI